MNENDASSYCSKCGGLNQLDATTCFACGAAMQGTTGSGGVAPVFQPAGAGAGASAGSPTPLAGSAGAGLLKDRYRLVSQIGEGGFGAVYKAQDTQLGNRLVAVKEMRPGGLTPQEAQEATEAFHREALLLAGLNHPSLPRIYEHLSEGGRWYLVMEYIAGETLEGRLKHAPQGRLPVREALDIALQLCTVLDFLHSRVPPIIFRDLKPSNVMLAADGQLYLIDFGIARHFKPGQSKDTMAFGSPGYAAPEQYGKAQTTPRSDVFSLGALLHQMLSGDDPANTPFRFAGLTMPLPSGLGSLIRHMVDLDEQKRPASMAVVKRQLEGMAEAWGKQPVGPVTKALASYQSTTKMAPAVLGSAKTQAAPPIVQVQAKAPVPPKKTKKSGGRTFRWLILVGVATFFWLRACSTTHHPTFTTSDGYATPTSVVVAGSVNVVAWSPSGKQIAAAYSNGIVEVWDVSQGKVWVTYTGHRSAVDALAWSPDGSMIASADTDGTVQVWFVDSGAPFTTYRGHANPVWALAWSPDGTRIASGSLDGTVQVWDMTNSRKLLTYTGHTDYIYSVAWSPDGSKIASGSKDTTVQVWDATTGTTLYTYRGHKDKVSSVAWSPKNALIASASDDKTVQVWDALTGSNALTYSGHTDAVEAVAWSPDGTKLASGGYDNTVQVWDAATGTESIKYAKHSNTVWSVMWSPNGRQIASGSSDGTVQVWDATTGITTFTYGGK